MKKFIKTPTANRFLAEGMKGLSVHKMEEKHLGRTGQRKV